MALDTDRRRQLHALKLKSLAETYLGISLSDLNGTEDGAIGIKRHDNCVTAVILAEERCSRAVGVAMAAATQAKADVIHIFAKEEASSLASAAELFRTSSTVWELNDRVATIAVASDPTSKESTDVDPELIAVLEAADLDVVYEHGIVAGEIRGLEVARIESDGEEQRIAVGVGAHDREAFALLHGGMPSGEALLRVTETVRFHRRAGAEPHPLNRLNAERWLRSQLIGSPQKIGATVLSSASPPTARRSLKETIPAVAYGRMAEGNQVVVVCTIGIDLNLIAFGAQARMYTDPEAQLIFVVPERDAHPLLKAMVEKLMVPAELIAIDDDWRDWKSSGSLA
ncbi:MAG: hypothetical protein GWP30_09415 [Actinobacteria bacterium]|nr:hypothetical protein [Actinomycetota bacterium]